MTLQRKEATMENRFDFDALAKTLSSGLPRREALRRLGGGLAGALLASLGLGKTALSDPAPNASCVHYCRDTCGINPRDGSAFGNCVGSCGKCLGTNRSLLACPPSAGAGVVCSVCESDQFLCLDGSCCDEPCCGGVVCCTGQQCDSESNLCF